jgi:hypothetical protein
MIFNLFQAVRSKAECGMEIPTDDHYKKFGNKVPKPDKTEVVKATKANKRF